MQIIDPGTLTKIVGGRPDPENLRAVISGIDAQGRAVGLGRPHRLACYLAQIAHESMAFRYDRELWGPTPAQRRYDTRADLGNTPEADGDGFLYRGRGPIQITGKDNYGQFRDWCRAFSRAAPNFVANPDAVLTDPWEGLAPIWYWRTRDLNRYADDGDMEMITRRINGGLNGYADRLRYYDRAALVLIGREPEDTRGFQDAAGLVVDGISGPRTRAAMHAAMVELPERGATSRLHDDCILDDLMDLSERLANVIAKAQA